MDNNLGNLQIHNEAEARSGRVSPFNTTTASTDNCSSSKKSSSSTVKTMPQTKRLATKVGEVGSSESIGTNTTAESHGAAVGIQEAGATCIFKENDDCLDETSKVLLINWLYVHRICFIFIAYRDMILKNAMLASQVNKKVTFDRIA